MNDATNLYIAVEIQDNDDDTSDMFNIVFDNDNSGGSPSTGDNS